VELTAVGREILPQARGIVQEMTAVVEWLKDISQRAKGNFTLACIPSMSSHVLPQVIRRYAESHPENRIRLQGNYEVQHHATTLNLMAAGVGSAILPSSTFKEGDRPGLRKITITRPTVKRKVVLLRRARGSLSPAVEAFHELLRKTPLDL
jgi:DNA-binding transcriptional LysR family regulator